MKKYSLFAMSFCSEDLSLIRFLLEESVVISFKSVFLIEELLIGLVSFVSFRYSDIVIFEIAPKVIDHYLKAFEGVSLAYKMFTI